MANDKNIELVKAIKDLTEKLRNKSISEAAAAEKLEKMSGATRKTDFASGDVISGTNLSVIHKSEGGPVEHKAFREACDDVYLMSKLLKTSPRNLKSWKRLEAGASSELRKAMDTANAGEGLEWVPTEFSSELADLVKLEFKVGGLFRRINMPSNPYKLPVVSSDATGYLISEEQADSGTKITASTPGTTNVTLSAVKIAGRVLFSEELSEDSIIPIAAFVKKSLARSLAEAFEDAVLNGDTAGTHQDFDVTAATDARKAWDGLRKMCQSGNKVDLGTFNTAGLRQMRQKLGKYGVMPSDLAWITGTTGAVKMLQLAEVLTVDKYGANATVVTGEIGKFDGIPIVISEKIREDMNSNAVFDGTDQDKTAVLLVYRPGFVIGDRREVKVKTFEDIQTDQTILVATARWEFEDLYAAASNSTIAVGRNVSLTI